MQNMVLDNPFLNLPGEIRNQVYRLLLIVPDIAERRILGETNRLHPQILSVCKQTYHEAVGILYGENVYIAHHSMLTSMPQLRRWLDPITSARLTPKIRRFHIHIRLDCDPRFKAAAAQDAFNGVEQLTIEVFQSAFQVCDHKILSVFEGVRGVGTAKVYGSISGFPEYAKQLEGLITSSQGKMELSEVESVGTLAIEPSTTSG